MMDIPKTRTLALLLMALIVVGASAKPSYTGNRKEQLHNRRGWFESNGATFTDLGDTNIEDHMFNRRGDSTFSDLDDTLSDAAYYDSVSEAPRVQYLSVWDLLGDYVADADVDLADSVTDYVDYQKRGAADVTVQHQKRRFTSLINNLGATLSDTAGNVGETLNDWGGRIGDAAGDFAETVVEPVLYDKRGAADNTVQHQKRHQESGVLDHMAQHKKRDQLYNRRGWFDSIGDTFSDLGDTLSDAASNVGDTVSDWGDDIGVHNWDDAIVDTAGNVGDTVSGWGDDIGIGHWDDAIVDTAGNVGDTLSVWGGDAADAAGNVAGTLIDYMI